MSSQRGSDSDDDPLLLISSSYRPHKRRRVEPPVSDEIIESSDAEEREEELAAAQPGYWTKLPTPHATISVGPLGGGQRRVDDAEREQHQQVVDRRVAPSFVPETPTKTKPIVSEDPISRSLHTSGQLEATPVARQPNQSISARHQSTPKHFRTPSASPALITGTYHQLTRQDESAQRAPITPTSARETLSPVSPAFERVSVSGSPFRPLNLSSLANLTRQPASPPPPARYSQSPNQVPDGAPFDPFSFQPDRAPTSPRRLLTSPLTASQAARMNVLLLQSPNSRTGENDQAPSIPELSQGVDAIMLDKLDKPQPPLLLFTPDASPLSDRVLHLPSHRLTSDGLERGSPTKSSSQTSNRAHFDSPAGFTSRHASPNPPDHRASGRASPPPFIPPELDPPQAGRRSLRDRTAIQLQPYTREALFYKATLARAGAKEAFVKDVRQVAGVLERHDAMDLDETQDWDASQAQEQESYSPIRRPSKEAPWKKPLFTSSNAGKRKAPPTQRPAVPPLPQPRRPTPPSPASPSSSLSPPPPPRNGPNISDAEMRRKVIEAVGGLISDDDDDDSSMEAFKSTALRGTLPTKAQVSVASMARHRSSAAITQSSTSPLSRAGSTSSTTAIPLPSLSPRYQYVPSSPPSHPASRIHRRLPSPEDNTTAAATPDDREVIAIDDDTPPASRRRRRSPITIARPGDSESEGSVPSDEGIENGGDESDVSRDVGYESKRDKRLRKTVVRVFPAFMVKKMMQGQNGDQRSKTQRQSSNLGSEGDDDNGEEEPQRSGRRNSDDENAVERSGRVRIVPKPPGRLEIQGDPESSEPEREREPFRGSLDEWGPQASNTTSDGWGIGGHDPVWEDEDVHGHEAGDDRIAFSEESDSEPENEAGSSFNVDSWLDLPSSPRPQKTDRREAAPLREGDLIDRMLSRHVNISSTTRRKPKGATGTSKQRRRGARNQTTMWDFQDTRASEMRSGPSVAGRSRQKSDQPSRPKIVVNVDRRPASSSTSRPHKQARPRGARREEPVTINFRQETSAAYPKVAEPMIVISDDDDDRIAGNDNVARQTEDLFDLLRPHQTGAADATTPTSGPPHAAHRTSTTAHPGHPRRSATNLNENTAPTSYTSALSRKGARDSLIDFGLPSPPSASSFSPTTYLGSGQLTRLLALISSNDPAPRPTTAGALDPSLKLADLEDRLPALFDSLYEWSLGTRRTEESNERALLGASVLSTMQFLCEYVSWSPPDDILSGQDVMRLAAILQEQIQHLLTRMQTHPQSEESQDHALRICWFAVELSLRIWHSRSRNAAAHQSTDFHLGALAPSSATRRYLDYLISRMIEVEFVAFRSRSSRESVDVSAVPQDLENTSAELWVCCLHLLEAVEGPMDDNRASSTTHPLWDYVLTAVQHNHRAYPAVGLEPSEKLWRCVTSLMIFSRFSVHGIAVTNPRLRACWPIIQQALVLIRLEADPDRDVKMNAAVLQQRDAYIRLVLARCLLLVTRWKWNLCGADALFKSLTAIFRTRKFENLRGETSDFPIFLRELNDEAYLDAYDRKETSFGIFLKLVLHAAKDYEQDPRGPSFGQKQVRKLASLIFPIGTTPFTRDNPPVGRELSMLFNRLAAVVVTVHLEPTNTKLRIQQALRFMDFKNAESNSRSAYIRGMMQIAVVHRRKNLDIEEIMGWYCDMAGILLDDLKEAEKLTAPTTATHATSRKREVALLTLQLMGALRIIIDTTPVADPVAQYPSPIFLEQACLDQIMASSLSDDIRTSVEIRKLIQAFLDARTRALGPRKSREPATAIEEESETQQSDEYGDWGVDWGVDWDDPRLLVALGEGEKTDEMIKEERVTTVIKSILSPAIFRFIQQHFGDAPRRNKQTDLTEEREYDDKWIECWVRCIEVLVRNNVKTWPQYQEWGDESLDRIVDPVSRRAIELRFVLTILSVDPEAYPRNQDWCVRVWLATMVDSRLTREHDYTSELLSVDKGKHPLLSNLPLVAEEDGRYVVTAIDLQELRLPILRAVTRNLVGVMRRIPQSPKDMQVVAVGVNGLLGALSAIKEHCEKANQTLDEGYLTFCREFVDHLKAAGCAVLWEEQRIANAATACATAINQLLAR